MLVSTLFEQNIARPIETVIKAEDRDHVVQEVSEYVVTADIGKKIAEFFDAYVDFSGINGAWISGFFGSGKSHLLKILSHVLDNQAHGGRPVGEIFAAKIQDSILKANIEKAGRIPSESILFNIDNKASHSSSQQMETLLPVFYQVFYEHLGFFGSSLHIGTFEWMLWKQKKYKEFTNQFEAVSGKSWEERRPFHAFPDTKKAAAQALGNVLGGQSEDYLNILNDFKNTASTMSVDDFCSKVEDYLKEKPTGFRLNFFVDEVGQFIGSNTKLMLNLQTIAETLAVKCKGRSWVLVTSQDDLERIVGDMNASQHNDFSKITARFKTKMPLTSANVDEVIQKRLLEKNEDGKVELKGLWAREHANLSTLLRLSTTGRQFVEFKNDGDFVNKYPFIPYQFYLFQECIRQLSTHNAFQGRHASVGERSMLGVFQEVLKQAGDYSAGYLVSFDRLFDGLRNTIKSEVQAAIFTAENNLGNDLAKRVLRVLFMVKYYSAFSANLRNLATLLIDNVNVDVTAHEQQVKEALELLEQQTYIRRNGDLYEYLTDEEKDIENSIKAVDIDNQQVGGELHKLLYDDIIADNKLRYAANKQDYGFTRKVDGVLYGRESELILDIITPNHPQFDDEQGLRALTMGYPTMALFRLPDDATLLPDVRMYLKTEKYVRQQSNDSPSEGQKRILREKQERNDERRRTLVNRMRALLGEAKVYLSAREVTNGTSTDGKIRVNNAFQELINVAYPSLALLNNVTVTEADVRSTLQAKHDDLFAGPKAAVSAAEQAILNYVHLRKQQSERTSVVDVRDNFGRKPYGWYPNAVYNLLANLYKRGKLELRRDTTILTDNAVLDGLLNNRQQGSTMLEIQLEFDAQQVKKLCDLYRDAFDKLCPSTDAKEIANQFRIEAAQQLGEVNVLLGQKAQYPFLVALEPVRSLFADITKRDNTALVTEVRELEKTLLDLKEDVLDPIRQFMSGGQRTIFDQVRSFMEGQQSNFSYVDHTELDALKEAYQHPSPYKGKVLTEAKGNMTALQTRVNDRIKQEREETIRVVEQLLQQLQNRPEFAQLDAVQQQDVLTPFRTLRQQVNEHRFIADLQLACTRAGDPMYLDALNRLTALTAPAKKEDDETPGVEEPRIRYVNSHQIKVSIGKTELQSPGDVEEYLTALRTKMLGLLDQNQRIVLPA
ncbi:BREX system P-loop protein BrxC [Hymenobacter artigasi]|uniref:BREX system P-loop protein BrxC n=1 Tax=Hymenobacter artigasi TaxID=2719616 RepID=A0ABX1HMX7_9BACT|nr:BREX system P-loop protein BrxC [Hymenobacter artigasi]NKI91608.1 hypothetical protein [Hymenobacter artigasi]